MLNHQDIKRFNPQRYPIALVDRILECSPNGHATAIKVVTASDHCYAEVADSANFTAMAYPYSLMIESFCQAAGPLAMQLGLTFADQIMLFASMGDIEFLGSAYPGDTMTHHIRVTKVMSDAVVAEGEITVNGRPIAKFGQLMVVARKSLKDELR